VDFSIAFRRLSGFSTAEGAVNESVRDLFLDRAGFDAWAATYARRLRAEASIDAERALRLKRVNPKFVLRNHLAELAIRQAQQGDFDEIHRLLKVLQHPYDEQPEHSAYAGFPPDWAQTIAVSCSS
ncbi:MAG TPA: protein adenylyltransferase SelO family protein, partial [Methylibium sp.]